MTVRAQVDPDTCISSGKCVADAPTAFEFDDDEIAEPIDGGRAMGADELKGIARNCPSGAIRLVEGDTEIMVE